MPSKTSAYLGWISKKKNQTCKSYPNALETAKCAIKNIWHSKILTKQAC